MIELLVILIISAIEPIAGVMLFFVLSWLRNTNGGGKRKKTKLGYWNMGRGKSRNWFRR
jgi:hypothetical protein